MHKTRITSAVIGLILWIAVVVAGNVTLAVAVTFLALIGINEFYRAVSNGGYKPVKILGYIASFSIILIGLTQNGLGISFLMQGKYFAFAVFLVLVALFLCIVFSENGINVVDVALTLLGIVYVVFLFSFIVLTRNMEYGKVLVWLIFIGAWATDTFAYIFGSLFGKTKILPVISPNKSLEGSLGGIVGCVLLMMLYGVLLNSAGWVGSGISLYHFVIMGVICGIMSQIGDWVASAIKRYVKVKDYGKIMPGHGGVLDRFDSILFTAPVIYFYISFIII